MLIWCPLCRRKVEVNNFTERIVTVNHGSRKLVEGKDSKGHSVSTYASMKPQPTTPVRKIRRKKSRRIRTYMDV